MKGNGIDLLTANRNAKCQENAFRRNRVMNESLNLGDSINHVYMPTVSD